MRTVPGGGDRVKLSAGRQEAAMELSSADEALVFRSLQPAWRHLPRSGSRAERSGASLLTAAEWDAIYWDAARQAAMAAEHIRWHTRRDPDQAADAAQAAADTLHAAARNTGSRNLRCAADTFDRAGRAPYGRMPCRTRDGDRLRAVARMLTLTGGMSDGLPLAAAALIANLAGLAGAVAELRQAQRHAAQAAAARAAAERLHAAHAQIRAEVPRFGRAEAPRRARPGSAEKGISREFPLSPLADLHDGAQPGPADAEAAWSRPVRASGRSARASPRR